MFFLTLIVFFFQGFSQQKAGNSFKIVFYNVENLFDTIDDPLKTDNDFLPTSKVPWNSQRYHQKLMHTATVIKAIDSLNLPAVVGLAEVENAAALQDLIMSSPLRAGKYQAILEEGLDPRGIDVALIYRPEVMKYAGHHSYPSATSFKTRSLLHVKLVNAKKDTFHIIVNHWKSRSGGAVETEAKRIENAEVIRHLTDSLFAINLQTHIVVVGDLNDEPTDKSVSEVLGAKNTGEKISPNSLYNLMSSLLKNGEGTLYYKDWDLFDQIIVSGNLLLRKPNKGPVISRPYAYIFKPDWILYKNKNGEMVPNRTANGNAYFGGYSDHLPVYTIVKNGPAILDD